MRRLSMRTKRRKSERNSDSESEENGVESQKLDDTSIDADENPKKDKENAGRGLQSNRKSRRSSRPRQSNEQKTTAAAAMTTTTTTTTTTTNSKQQAMKSKKQQLDSKVGTTSDSEQENGNATKQGTNKRRRKDEMKSDHKIGPTSSHGAAAGEQEYEVDKIVGHRTIKGRRQFLIRWKGYGEESDTWEQEKDLNCPKLIENFLAEEAETNTESEEAISEKSPKLVKTKPSKTEKKKEIKKSKNNNKRQSNQTEEDEHESEDSLKSEDGQKEFEVDKIMEVRFKKNKKRLFLIRWKGFSPADDTWEPEENLSCPELISKFMEKVEKARTTDMRELRTNPTHTKRYTLSTHDSGRRLSRRNMDKQRATYHECDE
ncbi:hypothetical protein KPH14_011814 [Odynerus spinipes]|uniref:Chromo domain-containing protein n=1 Tax=Odynerus spinipes TaxID=1348599 RepID=A0AAD9VU19_9HYME|nr:hypothetical protein KPH14_011814 [Odynerus spinipes]